MAHRQRWLIGTGILIALATALALIATGGQPSLAIDSTIYVDADAPGPTHDGSSWANAYTTLQPALAAAEAGQQIWVAEGVYKPTEGIAYASCQEIHDAFPNAPDGDYLLNNEGRVFQVYCADMDSSPLEYLSLEDANDNFSQYTAGGGAPGTDVRTYYSRVRLLPDTWQIDIADQRYAGSTGMIGEPPDAVTSMPYGVAMDCLTLSSATGVARIDLRDTPLQVTDTFMQCGYLPGGTSTFSEDNQVVELTGGGYCGWTQPASEEWLNPPFNDAGGPQPILELDYLHPERRAAFQLKNGVALYGGFDGTETDLEERDWEANPTILSGDIGVEGDASDNVYHVFYHPDGTNLDGTAILDGFTVTGGTADGDAQRNTFGAGMYNDSSSPTLTNVTFAGNSASGTGGGVYNWYSSPALANCTFEGNSALENGGGMANFGFAATLTDCTFEDNSAGMNGGGIYESNSSSPVLSNCSFVGNSAGGDGGGMYDVNGSPVLTNCTFEGNSAWYGGGMHVYNNSSAELTDCTFTGNSAYISGGGMQNSTFSSPVLTNCTFSGNSAGSEGGGLNNIWSSSPTLTNCTFTGNSAADGGAISNYESSSPTLTNCILWGDTSPEVFGTVESEPVITYSDIDGGYTGVGNIDENPLFVAPGTGDLRLQLSSPAIDAGNNAAVPAAFTDLGGNPRFADVASVTDTGSGDPPIVDMGAYEAPPEIIFVDLEATGDSNGTSWDDAFTDVQDALAWAQDGVEIWVAEGTYTPSQEFAPGDPRSATFQMVNGVAIYGGFDPTVGHTGWQDRDWETNTTILSGDIGIEGDASDNVYHVFYHPAGTDLDTSAILDGFTITASNADHPDEPHDGGGGMYNEGSSPTLANCTFADNSAAYGGGMMNWDSSPVLTQCTFSGNEVIGIGGGIYNGDSAPVLANCAFTDNTAAYGGGMFNQNDSPTLTDCTFAGNLAGDWGGGMWNDNSSPTLTNCTFSGNSADYGGGIYNYAGSAPVLTNCTFAGNSAGTSGGGIYNRDHCNPVLTNTILWGDSPDAIASEQDSTPFISYSDIEGGCETMPENECGTGNINQDPLFLDPDNDDVHLGPGSPCIDAGDNTPTSLPLQDFEGDPRIRDGDGDGEPVVDMGVDEALWLPVYLPLVLRGY